MRLADRVLEEARQLQPLRVAVTLVAAPLWLVGFALGKLVAGAWAVGTWIWQAAVLGFRDARGKAS